MKEIKLEKRFPHIKDEDVTRIFQEGYIKGFKNGRKGTIPVDWIEKQKVDFQNEDYPFNYLRGVQDGYNDCIDYLIDEWEEENGKSGISD